MDRLTWRALHHTLLVSFVMFTVATVVTAQTFTGAVRGAVREESSAVVPGVTVQLVNEASNASREAVSNHVGEYSFSAVPPGTYTIRASLTGFKTFEQRRIRVATQQFITLREGPP